MPGDYGSESRVNYYLVPNVEHFLSELLNLIQQEYWHWSKKNLSTVGLCALFLTALALYKYITVLTHKWQHLFLSVAMHYVTAVKAFCSSTRCTSGLPDKSAATRFTQHDPISTKNKLTTFSSWLMLIRTLPPHQSIIAVQQIQTGLSVQRNTERLNMQNCFLSWHCTAL